MRSFQQTTSRQQLEISGNMSAILKAFILDGTSWDVRILYDEESKPWFCANDVGCVLEMTNIRASMTYFDESEKGLKLFDTPGGAQEMTFLSKKGVFKLLMRSNKPIAKTFQEWVWQVLDEVEETGRYELQRSFEEEARATKERLEKQLSRTRHDVLVQAYHKKPVVYFCKIRDLDDDDDKFLLKIGSTADLTGRVPSLARDYQCIPTILDVVECRQHIKLERLLHGHEIISPHFYAGNVCENRTSTECFVADPQLVPRFVAVAKRNVRKCELSDEAFFEIEKCKLDIQKKKLEVKLEELKSGRALEQVPEQEYVDASEESEESDDETLDMRSFEWLVKTTSRKTVRGPKVQKYDPETKELICTYDGLLEACRDVGNGASPGAMKAAARERRIFHEFRWYLLDRQAPNDSVIDIGDTCRSTNSVHAKDYVVFLNLDKTRIEKVFADQKSAADYCKFKSISAISCAIKRGSRTCGHYANFWLKCSEELRSEYLSRESLPVMPARQGSRCVLQLHPVTKNVVKKHNSIQDVIREHKMSRRSVLQSIDAKVLCHGFFWRFE